MEARNRDHEASLTRAGAGSFQGSPARISLRGARAAYVGPGLDLAPHRNAVATLAFGLDSPFELHRLHLPDAPTESCRAALIPPGELHHLKARGRMAFVYLDAMSDDHAVLKAEDIEAGLDRLVTSAGALQGAWSVDDLCVALSLPRRPTPDPRIAALIRAIDAEPEAFPRLSGATELTGLSPSRVRALVREAVGVPLRRYRLWRRMARVAEELSRGGSLTTAAHAAGFASSAHLSASFRAMFGLSPSDLLKSGAVFDLG